LGPIITWQSLEDPKEPELSIDVEMGIHVPPNLIGDDYYCYPDADAAEPRWIEKSEKK
jgi:hypothetical protein